MKRTLLTAATLALLAITPALVRADSTNAPSSSEKKADVKPYPLKTCLVSGEKFGGDMGKPVTLTYKGQEMKFCCNDCVKDFKKDPEKWMKKLDKAAKKEAAKSETK